MKNERSPYQKEMDSLHVSDEKAKETLGRMLKENDRLNAKRPLLLFSGKARTWFNASSWIAAAACAVLLFFALGTGNGFTSLHMSTIPMSMGARGGTEKAVSFEEAFGLSAEQLFPGARTAGEHTLEYASEDGPVHEGSLSLRTDDGHEYQALVTDYEPALYTTLKAGNSIRLAKDEDTDRLYAVYREGKLYVTLWAEDMPEKVFSEAVQGLKGKKP